MLASASLALSATALWISLTHFAVGLSGTPATYPCQIAGGQALRAGSEQFPDGGANVRGDGEYVEEARMLLSSQARYRPISPRRIGNTTTGRNCVTARRLRG